MGEEKNASFRDKTYGKFTGGQRSKQYGNITMCGWGVTRTSSGSISCN
jgi:hypothetical protein